MKTSLHTIDCMHCNINLIISINNFATHLLAIEASHCTWSYANYLARP